MAWFVKIALRTQCNALVSYKVSKLHALLTILLETSIAPMPNCSICTTPGAVLSQDEFAQTQPNRAWPHPLLVPQIELVKATRLSTSRTFFKTKGTGRSISRTALTGIQISSIRNSSERVTLCHAKAISATAAPKYPSGIGLLYCAAIAVDLIDR